MTIPGDIEYSIDKQNERIRFLEEALLQTLEKKIRGGAKQ